MAQVSNKKMHLRHFPHIRKKKRVTIIHQDVEQPLYIYKNNVLHKGRTCNQVFTIWLVVC